MAGFDNDVIYGANVDFRGVKPIVGQVTTDGQLLIGSTASPHIKVGSLSSSDSSVTITTGSGTINLSVTGGTTVGKTITGNSGGALSPTAGNWNILGSSAAAGTSPVTTSGAGSTLTVNVQTSQALAGADATKIGLSNFSSTDFAVAATGFVTLSTTGAGKTITGDTGGALSPTANNWNILGGPGVTTSGSGSTLTINSITFVDTSGTFTAASDTGYFLTTTSTPTLPAAPSQGDTVIFVADTANPIVVTANTGQTIRFGNAASSVAGTWTNSAQGDSLTLRYRSSTSTWFVVSSIGIWVPA